MDLLMWSLHISGRGRVRDAIWRMASFAEREHGIVCRPMRKRDLDAEVSKFLEVYNAAWERNWASVPLTDEEVHHYAKDLSPVLDENWAYVAERADTGEVVGVALTLPDFNQVLAHLGGRLLPFGWAKALYWRRKIDAVRVFALGVKPAYQHTGVAARFYQLQFDAAERTPQKGGEMGWILETNRPMNRAMEGMGGEIVRRFRDLPAEPRDLRCAAIVKRADAPTTSERAFARRRSSRRSSRGSSCSLRCARSSRCGRPRRRSGRSPRSPRPGFVAGAATAAVLGHRSRAAVAPSGRSARSLDGADRRARGRSSSTTCTSSRCDRRGVRHGRFNVAPCVICPESASGGSSSSRAGRCGSRAVAPTE